MRSILTILVVLFSMGSSLGQQNIPIGTWRSHFNYDRTHLVEVVGDRVYCAAQSGLFFFNLSDNSLNKLSKIEGLSDTRITAMFYDEEHEVFVIGYESGNIDILRNNEILNVTKIKKSDVNQSKVINHIIIRNGLIYISTNFGVIVLDQESGEVEEAYQNLGTQGGSIKVNGTAFGDDRIYVATNFGILQGDIAPNINLQDFNNWERFENSVVFDKRMVSIARLEDKIITTDGIKIFSYDGSDWINTGFDNSGVEILRLRKYGQGVVVILEEGIQTLDSKGIIEEIQLENGDLPRDAILGPDGILWYSDAKKGLSRLEGNVFQRFVPNGIFEGPVGKIQLVGEKIVALPLSRSSLYKPINNNLGYAEFEEGQWNIVSSNDLFGIDNISSVSPDGKLVASFGDGILNKEEGLIYNETNSPLTKGGFLNEDILVSGLAMDSQGNTWVANASSSPLLKKDVMGNWESFSFGVSASERPVDIKINSLGQVWMLLSSTNSGGILAYDPATETSRYLTSSNGKLPSTGVTDLEFTTDSEVWIGTENGLAFFPFSFGVINDLSIVVSKPVFDNNFLFEFESISAVEIDAGNRKWVGTKEGLWLFEDNADLLVHNFNIDNSPIPSNNILDLKIHPKTGELFISTDKGLVSFRSDATKGEEFHQEVKIFPNPVLPGYTGFVGISGLVNDAIVKITNVSGRLVREIHATGGSTSWNVADYNGVRAQSGVYLVFSASSDGKETFVGKIAVIN